jgi:hypothetical protein
MPYRVYARKEPRKYGRQNAKMTNEHFERQTRGKDPHMLKRRFEKKPYYSLRGIDLFETKDRAIAAARRERAMGSNVRVVRVKRR